MTDWLQQQKLSRPDISEALDALGVAAPDDLLELTEEDVEGLSLRPLERRRWDKALADIKPT